MADKQHTENNYRQVVDAMRHFGSPNPQFPADKVSELLVKPVQ
jgi:hypothetical protein